MPGLGIVPRVAEQKVLLSSSWGIACALDGGRSVGTGGFPRGLPCAVVQAVRKLREPRGRGLAGSTSLRAELCPYPWCLGPATLPPGHSTEAKLDRLGPLGQKEESACSTVIDFINATAAQCVSVPVTVGCLASPLSKGFTW